MNITIKSIPHNEQRYDTCGDYWETPEGVEFRISAMRDRRYVWLVAVHELVEYMLVKTDGIPLLLIDEFDRQFEAARKPGNDEEPGDDKNAPYHKQHRWATRFERVLALVLGVHWWEYEFAILDL